MNYTIRTYVHNTVETFRTEILALNRVAMTMSLFPEVRAPNVARMFLCGVVDINYAGHHRRKAPLPYLALVGQRRINFCVF